MGRINIFEAIFTIILTVIIVFAAELISIQSFVLIDLITLLITEKYYI